MDTEYDRKVRQRLLDTAAAEAAAERELGLAVAAARDVGWSWRSISAVTGIAPASHGRRHGTYRVEEDA